MAWDLLPNLLMIEIQKQWFTLLFDEDYGYDLGNIMLKRIITSKSTKAFTDLVRP